MKLLAIAGSLRENSYNRQLAEAAGALMREKHPEVGYGILRWEDVPFMNQDIEHPAPEAVMRVREYDVIITVDAVDGTDADPGTVFRFEPDAMARHSGATASLHDLKLVDLFDAAALLGYEAEGLCLGMQVENPSPAVVTVGLTPKVDAALPLLVETVAGELARLGSPLRARA